MCFTGISGFKLSCFERILPWNRRHNKSSLFQKDSYRESWIFFGQKEAPRKAASRCRAADWHADAHSSCPVPARWNMIIVATFQRRTSKLIEFSAHITCSCHSHLDNNCLSWKSLLFSRSQIYRARYDSPVNPARLASWLVDADCYVGETAKRICLSGRMSSGEWNS